MKKKQKRCPKIVLGGNYFGRRRASLHIVFLDKPNNTVGYYVGYCGRLCEEQVVKIPELRKMMKEREFVWSHKDTW